MKTDVTPLQKDHLVVMAVEFSISVKVHRNSTGHLIRLEGVAPLMLDWLSVRYNFDYSVLDSNATSLEDSGPHLPGLISYAVKGECDVILAVMVHSQDRLKKLELLHPWFYAEIVILLPLPEVLNNVNAVIKPFQPWVWVALGAASTGFIVTLLCLNRYLKSVKQSIQPSDILATESIYMYVVVTLLNQGGYISSKLTPIRLVVGAWCLLTLVLLNVYNGVLTSYLLVTPYSLPLLNSMEDAAYDPNIFPVLVKNKGVDILFLTADKGLFKAFGDKLRANPKLRCNSSRQCVQMVTSLPHQHAYIEGLLALKEIIKDEYNRTGQCKTTIMKVGEASRPTGWALRKRSTYSEKFNRGMLVLRETGLISQWEKQFEANSRPCYDEDQNYRNDKNKKKPLARLSLANLTGAFAALGTGVLVSFLAFLIELLVARVTKKTFAAI
ncbi:ionotropic receptor 93a isoform X2 [Daphnia magna]|nr:ionotropic receptor 93a isoform X2 [Daphnia magna]XP_032786280.2 ionotropic receptor 93a isoform X2 [Daphnia magna]